MFNKNKVLNLLIKIVVTGLCLWFVSTKIQWSLSLQLLQQSNKGLLIVAGIFFIFSKIISTFRLNIYFHNINLQIPPIENLKLYWVGMFYNIFLPGGIGGDAYKIIILKKKHNLSLKPLTTAVLLDRVSGIVGLILLAIICFCFVNNILGHSVTFLFSILPLLIIYYIIINKFFTLFVSGFTSTLILGIIVQILQVLCVFCLMTSIHITQSQPVYIFIFLISSVVAILPFSIGGLGVREMVFLWGSYQFLLDKQECIYISILFYIITVIVSFIGIIWIYSYPLKK
jgi:glycosyltransferase 2 family protein